MGDQAARHCQVSDEWGVRAVRLDAQASALASKIVEQPDHHPVLVEQAVDVAEESVEQGLQSGIPLFDVASLRIMAVVCYSKFSRGLQFVAPVAKQ